MCMHSSVILPGVTEQSVFVIREIRKDEIRSPYQDFCKWEIGELKSTGYMEGHIVEEISNYYGRLWQGVFHSFKYLSDAISQLHEDFDEFSYVIYEATASGVIGEGLNDYDMECFFSTELTLNKIVFDKRNSDESV